MRCNKNILRQEIEEWAAEAQSPTLPEETILECVEALQEKGIKVGVSHQDPAIAPLIAEAVNWAAKSVDESFYALKAGAIAAAFDLGCQGGWGEDEEGESVFYLDSPTVGTVSFHDPDGLVEISEDVRWQHPWSEILRQNFAFDALKKASVRQLLAEATSPEGRLLGMSNSAVERCCKRLLRDA